MSGKVINLRRARKARTREDDRREGDVNAAKFGRPKAERELQAAQSEKAARDLDGHARET